MLTKTQRDAITRLRSGSLEIGFDVSRRTAESLVALGLAEIGRAHTWGDKVLGGPRLMIADAPAVVWVKLGFDDYESACGRFQIARLEACDNKYTRRDEWILSEKIGEVREGVDVYSTLAAAKEAAAEIASGSKPAE